MSTVALAQESSRIRASTDDEGAATRPNIIFIITDDQRADWLGVAGHPTLQTPHVDRLAEEGALFTNFYTTTPLCSSSRASFLTGQYPHTHGVLNNDKLGLDVISHTLMTFPRRLREEGYETAFIGKWHMGLDDSHRPGFDHWISFKGQSLYIDPVVNVNGESRQLHTRGRTHAGGQRIHFSIRSDLQHPAAPFRETFHRTERAKIQGYDHGPVVTKYGTERVLVVIARNRPIIHDIAWIDYQWVEADGTTFLECSDEKRRALLDQIAYPETAPPELSQGVAFFNSFRDLTASGFWTSRMGIDDLQYMGNVFVPEWTGCPPEALEPLDVSYDE
jgi:arylsulfatase A-like enzyme